MVDAAERLVEALRSSGKKVKTVGADSWIAQCPAHDDGRPSLSIRRSRGRVLTFCFAGCSADAVANAVGLRIEDLFDDPKGVSYQYKHGGRVVRTVHRSPSKRFSQQVIDKDLVTLYVPDGVDLASEVAAGNDIYIPEGEQDADTLAAIGVTAVSSPMGASNWSKADYSPLRGTSDLYVLADRDEPGLERAKGLAHLLTDYTSGTVQVLQPKVGKDITDHIVSGAGMEELVPVDIPADVDPEFEAAVNDAYWRERVTREARRRVQETETIIIGERLAPKTLGELLATENPHDWLVPEMLERQERVILTGHEGSGKSWMLRQIAIGIAAGVHPFNRSIQLPPRRVLVIDAENSERQWSRTAKYVTSIMESAGHGDPRSTVLVAAGVRIDLNRPADLNQVHELIDAHKPDVLYIGPLYKLVAKAITTDDDAAPLIVALDGFRERGLTLLMEAHAGHAKGIGGERDLRPRGSSALLGWPEFGFGLAPANSDDMDPDMFRMYRWRGERERRTGWPHMVRRGMKGEMPWMDASFDDWRTND